MKRVAIITSSDTGYRGEREDLSGPAIREIVEKNGYEVVSMDILPDDRQMLSERMKEIADSNAAELILTTGGTGFSPRDIMPEATEDIVDRRVPGIPVVSESDACVQYDHCQTCHAQPCYSRYPQKNTYHQSSGKPEGSKGKPGVYY